MIFLQFFGKKTCSFKKNKLFWSFSKKAFLIFFKKSFFDLFQKKAFWSFSKKKLFDLFQKKSFLIFFKKKIFLISFKNVFDFFDHLITQKNFYREFFLIFFVELFWNFFFELFFDLLGKIFCLEPVKMGIEIVAILIGLVGGATSPTQLDEIIYEYLPYSDDAMSFCSRRLNQTDQVGCQSDRSPGKKNIFFWAKI